MLATSSIGITVTVLCRPYRPDATDSALTLMVHRRNFGAGNTRSLGSAFFQPSHGSLAHG